MKPGLLYWSLWLVVVASGCQEPPPDTEAVVVWPNDTIVSAKSQLLSRPVDIAMGPAGTLWILDAGLEQVVQIDPTFREAEALVGRTSPSAQDDSVRIPASLNGSTLERGEAVRVFSSDGSSWTVTDSVPRLTHDLGPVTLSEAPLVAQELTSIRVNTMRRGGAHASVPTRYATDIRLILGNPTVLLNMTVEEGAVFLVFDSQGEPRGRLTLPATEGGRRFVVDTLRQRMYVIGPEPAQLLAVDVAGVDSLWRR